MGELVVTNRRTGQMLDIKDAATESLAEFCTDLDIIRGELADAEAAVKAELLDRLDRAAKWTLRVGDGSDREWTIEAPSPKAGTVDYPADMLLTELRALVERGTITHDAAAKALPRELTVTFSIPLDADAKLLERQALDTLSIELDGLALNVVKASTSSKASKAGIAAVGKVPGTSAALDRASVKAEPRRIVKVKLKARPI